MRIISRLIRKATLVQSRQSSSSAVDDLLRYVRSPAAQENLEQTRDILRSGLSHQEGSQAGRLHVALAESALETASYEQAVEHAAAAASAAAVSENPGEALGQDVEQAAFEIGCRALLTAGEDLRALDLAEAGLRSALTFPKDTEELLSQRWKHVTGATARYVMARMVQNGSRSEQGRMQNLRALVENDDAALGPLHGDKPDLTALPMMPRDMLIPDALLSYGAFAYTQGFRVQAERYLQRAAMAAEASRAQADDGGSPPLAPLTLQSTVLAGFSGHVQVEMSVGARQEDWKQAEMHLESALERAEAIGGADHLRIAPTLMDLSVCFARTGQLTIAEGLCRKIAKMLYRPPSHEAAFVPRRRPRPVHGSLEALLAWRFAQLLRVMPKRDTESQQWRRQAEAVAAEVGWEGPLEKAFGDIDSLRGGGGVPVGVFVHNALLRAIPCERSFIEEEVGSDAEHVDAEIK